MAKEDRSIRMADPGRDEFDITFEIRKPPDKGVEDKDSGEEENK